MLCMEMSKKENNHADLLHQILVIWHKYVMLDRPDPSFLCEGVAVQSTMATLRTANGHSRTLSIYIYYELLIKLSFQIDPKYFLI